MPVSRMLPPKVMRSTMAAQRRGSVKVLVQPTGAGTCSGWGVRAAAWPFPGFPGSVISEARVSYVRQYLNS